MIMTGSTTTLPPLLRQPCVERCDLCCCSLCLVSSGKGRFPPDTHRVLEELSGRSTTYEITTASLESWLIRSQPSGEAVASS